MTTVTRNGVPFTVVYIDPSAASAGTGETYTSPLKDFPTTLEDQKCYLVRRTTESYKANMRMGNYSSIYNFMVMGMPKSGDLEWDLLDDSGVKTAWGNDTSDYAMIAFNTPASSSTNAGFCVNNIINMFFSRSYLFRDDTISATSYLIWMIYCSGSSGTSYTGGNFYFNYCKFGVLGADVESPTWRANNTNIDDGTTYCSRKMNKYLYAPYSNTISLDHCVFNHAVTSGSSSSEYYYSSIAYGIYSPYSRSLEIKNSTLTQLVYNGSYSSGYPSIYCGDTSKFQLFKFINNDIMMVVRGNYSTATFKPICYIYGFTSSSNYKYGNKVEIKNVRARCSKTKNATIGNMYYYKDQESYFSTLYINDSGSIQNYDIDNIDVDYTYETNGVGFKSLPFLYLSAMGCTSGLGTRRIKNMKVVYESDPKKCIYWDPSHSNGNDVSPQIYVYTYKRSNTIPDAGGSTEHYGYFKATDANIPLMENCYISAPLAKYALKLNYHSIKNSIIEGRLWLNDCNSVELEKLINHAGQDSGIYIDGMLNYIRIKDYQVKKDNPYSPYINKAQIECTYNINSFMGGGDIFIDNANCSMIDESSASTFYKSARGNFICPNLNGEGQYIQCMSNGSIKSWDCVRTGSSSAASLKCSLKITEKEFPITIGVQPYKGIQLQPEGTGNKTITAYIALKNFTADDIADIKNNIRLEANVPAYIDPDGTILGNKVYDSITDGSIVSDNSEWSNESGLVSMKIQLPVTVVKGDKPIDIKFHYNVAGTNKYLYFDPDVKIA